MDFKRVNIVFLKNMLICTRLWCFVLMIPIICKNIICSCYLTVSNAVFEIFSMFLIFCNLFHDNLDDWSNIKIWETRKIFANVRGRSRTAATSKMKRFVIIINGFQPLTIITKRSILDVAAILDLPLNIARGNVR